MIDARVRGAEAEGVQFEEAERAFETCYDDVHPTKPGKAPKGWWQGEYLGKTVLSMVGYARYAGDRHTRDFLEAKALKLLRTHQRPDAITEVCDVIHWMRLNRFLYEMTGKGKYLDFWERAFLNGFLAGVFRDGKWGAHDVRSHGRLHFSMRGEIGMEHHFCCIDNAPRAYWDYADVQVRERDDRVEVNFYTDTTYASDGLELAIEGDYPHRGAVALRVTADRLRRISLRIPDWVHGTMTVDGRAASGERTEIPVGRGTTTVRLGFDVTPRAEEVVLRNDEVSSYYGAKRPPVKLALLKTNDARVFRGKVTWEELGSKPEAGARFWFTVRLPCRPSGHVGKPLFALVNAEPNERFNRCASELILK